MIEDNQTNLIEMTADIVSAYVSKNNIAADSVAGLIASVHASLNNISEPVEEVIEEPRRDPAVPIRKSITPDFLICLEDGRKFKSLKRHLRTKYDMSPEDYRAKWNLPKDYPMVAPNYAAARSQLAKNMGLGLGGRQPPKAAAAKPIGRPRKAAPAAAE